ncbi:hypothetical protein [Rubritalea tangerina]|uniref:hypothetical protein n=1 Tax=Rubritalea tangerina TaxID=430798 RepID=UPI003605B1A5
MEEPRQLAQQVCQVAKRAVKYKDFSHKSSPFLLIHIGLRLLPVVSHQQFTHTSLTQCAKN